MTETGKFKATKTGKTKPTLTNSYFGWEDAKDDSASELAAKFMQRFPGIVLHGKGRDWAYAGWYLEMLGYAHEGGFPVAYDAFMDDIPEGFMKLTDGRTCLPLPPGGDAPNPYH